jgi:serine/threonine protein kinase
MTIPEIKNKDGKVYYDFKFYKKGGMGEIYKGTELETKENVILKLVIVDNPDEEELFMREINASSSLSHKNIVKTLATGKITIDAIIYVYIVQKYYPSGNLRSYIKPNIPLNECISMMFDILNGMKEVHKYIIHRDIKPENILVDSDGRLLITDFGLARYIDEKTRTKSFKGSGTIPYMAPECWTGDKNTASMDIYSLGIMFFEIFTGKWPYDVKTETEWKDCHLFTPLPDISHYRNDLSVKLKQIVQKMTSKKISERYKSIDEILEAFHEAKKLNDEEVNDVERLAALGNKVIQKKEAANLRELQELERKKNQKKLLNYHITELFNKFIVKADAINDRFEKEKITINKQSYDENTTNRSLYMTFNGKGIRIIFIDYDVIEKQEKTRRENIKRFQKDRYGEVMYPLNASFLEANNIVLIGLAETNYKIGEVEFGYNLLLKMEKDENYGNWFIMSFKSNTPPEPNFAIDLSVFCDVYEELKHNHSLTEEYRKFGDEDVSALFEKMFLS